jgi:hypothetical protein
MHPQHSNNKKKTIKLKNGVRKEEETLELTKRKTIE